MDSCRRLVIVTDFIRKFAPDRGVFRSKIRRECLYSFSLVCNGVANGVSVFKWWRILSCLRLFKGDELPISSSTGTMKSDVQGFRFD